MSAPRMSDGDWGPVKGTVLQLRSDGKSLPYILRFISTQSFQPSERQLRRALARWAKEENLSGQTLNGNLIAGASSLQLVGGGDPNFNQNGIGLGGTAVVAIGDMGTKDLNEKGGNAASHKSALNGLIPKWAGDGPYDGWKASTDNDPYLGGEHLPQAHYHVEPESDSFNTWEYINIDEGGSGEYEKTH